MNSESDNYESKLIIDERVDKILKNKDLKNIDIYYSPRSVYLHTLGMIMPYGGVALIFILILIIWSFKILFFPFLIYCLLIFISNHYLNNSFGLSNDELLVINSSKLFPRFERYKLAEIICVKRRVHKIAWTHFLILPSSYIEVHLKGKIKRYYCIWLEDNYFVENNVWKTMDWFEESLKKLNIKTEFWYPKS
jgi:hypothetical protein